MFSQLTKTSLYALLISISYVVSIYYKAPTTPRNSSETIKHRILRVSVITLFHILTIPPTMIYILRTVADFQTILTFSGFVQTLNFVLVKDFIKIASLFIALFIGPLLEYLSNGFDVIIEDALHYHPVRMARDLIVAPITEELIYTSCILTIYSPFLPLNEQFSNTLNIVPVDESTASSAKLIVLLTPLLFGVAHVHHAFELLKKGELQVLHVFLITFIQLAYTSMFGLLSNLIFLNSNNIWFCIYVHSFCNFVGLPLISSDSENKLWKFVYWLLLVFGVWFFKTWFWEWSATDSCLIDWDQI